MVKWISEIANLVAYAIVWRPFRPSADQSSGWASLPHRDASHTLTWLCLQKGLRCWIDLSHSRYRHSRWDLVWSWDLELGRRFEKFPRGPFSCLHRVAKNTTWGWSCARSVSLSGPSSPRHLQQTPPSSLRQPSTASAQGSYATRQYSSSKYSLDFAASNLALRTTLKRLLASSDTLVAFWVSYLSWYSDFASSSCADCARASF